MASSSKYLAPPSTRSSTSATSSSSSTGVSKAPSFFFPAIVTGEFNDTPLEIIDVVLGEYSPESCFINRFFKKTGVIIGQGSWGKVFLACTDKGKCEVVVKQFDIQDEKDNVTVSGFVQEAYYLHLLRNIKLNGQYIVPRLIEAIKCDSVLTALVMSRYDNNMINYGKQKYNNTLAKSIKYDLPSSTVKPNLFYDLSEFVRMFQIACTLSYLGLINLDLKGDQFIIGGDGEIEIAIADFGFTTFIPHIFHNKSKPTRLYFDAQFGWMGPQNKCNASAKISSEEKKAESLPIYTDTTVNALLNVFQLDQYFGDFTNTIIYEPKTQKYLRYYGFRYPLMFVENIGKYCEHVNLVNAENAEALILDLRQLGFQLVERRLIPLIYR